MLPWSRWASACLYISRATSPTSVRASISACSTTAGGRITFSGSAKICGSASGFRYSESVNLNGILAPICTPFTEDGEIHHEALRRNIEQYSKTGLLGFIVSGSTGEAPLLSVEEKRKLFATVREAADGRTL